MYVYVYLFIQVIEMQPNVYRVNVPPSGKITTNRHTWIMRAIHEQSREPYLHVADNAGPHQGEKVKLFIEALGGYPCIAPRGGHSSIAQIPDDHRIHGSQKHYVRKRAVKYYLDAARVSEGTTRQTNIPLEYLVRWISEWTRIYGRAEDVRDLFDEYLPPCVGIDGVRNADKRKKEILECLTEYQGPLREPPKAFIDGLTYKCVRDVVSFIAN